MRLTREHLVVGYELPTERPRCGDCKHCGAGEERAFGGDAYLKCRLHGFEIRKGGVCDEYAQDRSNPRTGDRVTRELFA